MDKVLDIRSEEAIKDIADRLHKMLDTLDDEVDDQTPIFGEYLALCCTRFAQHHPMARLLPMKLVSDLANVALRLGYFLAKKPHELEAQLNELKVTYGTVDLDEVVEGE